MRRRLLLVPVLLSAITRAAAGQGGPLTRPERTDFRETSRYADVLAFLDTVGRASPLIHLTSFGYSWEGRALPLAVAGTPREAGAQAVRGGGENLGYPPGGIPPRGGGGEEGLLQILAGRGPGGAPVWAGFPGLLRAPI